MKEEESQGLYIISVAARLGDVHPQTLRLYERKGLLRPSRTPKNRRRYSDADIIRLRRIQELTQVEGLNLSGVRKVLEMEEEIRALKGTVKALERQLSETREFMVREAEEMKRRLALSKVPPRDLVPRRRRATTS